MNPPPETSSLTGSLPLFQLNWKIIHPDPSVIKHIQGLQLPLTSPVIPLVGKPPLVSLEEACAMEEEIQILLDIGALYRPLNQLHEPYFLTQKVFRTVATYSESQGTKQIPKPMPLQDERLTLRSLYSRTRRIYDENRSQGCLSHGAGPISSSSGKRSRISTRRCRLASVSFLSYSPRY